MNFFYRQHLFTRAAWLLGIFFIILISGASAYFLGAGNAIVAQLMEEERRYAKELILLKSGEQIQEMESSLASTLETLSRVGAGFLYNYETKALKEVLEPYFAQEEVMAVEVVELPQNRPIIRMVKKTFDQTSDYRVLESQIVYKQTHLGRLAITYNVNRILQEAALQQEALHRHQIQTEAQVWENASGRIYRSAVLFGLLLLLMAGVTVGILLYLDRQVRRKSDELAAINEQLEKRVKEEVKKNRDREQMMIEQSKMAAMGEMIGAIAHQWRQPLNALGLYIQDVREAYAHHEMDGVYIEKMVDDSMNQINYMSKTIDDFRNFFKPSKMKTRFGVKESVEEVLNLLRPQLKSNAVGEVVIEAEGEESIVNGYKNEFEQVILNLLSNAKDAFWEAIGKGIITPQNSRIVIAITQKGAEVTVAVRDNAGGVAPEIIGRIFEPYFTTKEQGKGTGIGLYMSKTIIEKNMGGTIAAENIETDGLLGTQIVITLPLETHSADK